MVQCDLPWRSIWSADNPVDLLKDHLTQLVNSFVSIKMIRMRNRTNLGLMITGGVHSI